MKQTNRVSVGNASATSFISLIGGSRHVGGNHSVYMSAQESEALRVIAKREGRSVTRTGRRAIQFYLENQEAAQKFFATFSEENAEDQRDED